MMKKKDNALLFFLFLWLLISNVAAINAYGDVKTNLQEATQHTLFQRFLDRYVSGTPDNNTVVHYSKVTLQDKQMLSSYINALATSSLKLNRDEQLAFWINLYNALVIQVVLEHYPAKSIRDINIDSNWFKQFFLRGPWDAKLVTINSTPLSLNDIEHEIIRKQWQDNRVHYALNCASVGCPKLQTKVFQGATINEQLNKAAQEYINSLHGVSFENGDLIVSEIYRWYRTDFGKDDKAIIEHLKLYALPNLRKRLENYSHINNYKYDWSLNGD